MAVRINMSDGSVFIVNGSFSEIEAKVALASDDEFFLRIRNGANLMRSVNPRMITSMEEVADDSLTPEQAEVLEAARTVAAEHRC